MTIQELGNLGELIAAIATIATLVYLALQIRRNTAVGRATGTASHTAELNRFLMDVAKDPELYRVYWSGLEEPESLEPAEERKFDMLAASFLGCMHQTYLLEVEGALSPGLWEHYQLQLEWFLRQPGFRSYWVRWPSSEVAPFYKLVRTLLSENDSPAT